MFGVVIVFYEWHFSFFQFSPALIICESPISEASWTQLGSELLPSWHTPLCVLYTHCNSPWDTHTVLTHLIWCFSSSFSSTHTYTNKTSRSMRWNPITSGNQAVLWYLIQILEKSWMEKCLWLMFYRSFLYLCRINYNNFGIQIIIKKRRDLISFDIEWKRKSIS